MRWTAPALALLLLGAGCASRPGSPPPRATSAGWRIALSASPNVPREMDPAQFKVTITGSSGRPVSGAKVVLQLAMPAMDMGRNQVTAQAGAAGIYTATGRFSMPGDWQVTVQADKGTAHQSQSFPVTVQ